MIDKNMFETAFDAIDDEFLAEAKHPSIRIAARRKKIIISTIAACVAAILVSIPSVKVISDLNGGLFANSDDIEVIYQEEIIEHSGSKPQNNSTETVIMGGQGGGSTTVPGSFDYEILKGKTITVEDLFVITDGSIRNYTRSYVPDTKYLYINPVPTSSTATIYMRHYRKELDKVDAYSLADKFFPRIATALNAPTPAPYKVENSSNGTHIYTRYPTDDWLYHFQARDYSSGNAVIFSTRTDSMHIGGQKLSIDNLSTDEEFISAISNVKQKIFDIFEVQFDDIKVISEYNDDNFTSDPFFITVYFYNKSAHPLNSQKNVQPFSDRIYIEFVKAAPNKETGESNDGKYYLIDVIYQTNHTELQPLSEETLLSVEKASEYLKKGYVLLNRGGCSLCTAKKDPSTYIDYDYVSYEYLGGEAAGDLTLPYYVFYKNIGVCENGNTIYSKAYVPAIEVEGYEEYFENNHANH